MGYPHLPRAPIVEALLDIRVEPDLPSLDHLAEFEKAVLVEFPTRKDVVEWRTSMNLTAQSASVNPARVVRGRGFWSADGKRVVQARTAGFSMSHVAPYDRWESLRADAEKWWPLYGANAPEATHVTRVAVRFINRIELPLPVSDFRTYFRTYPEIGSELPQGLAALLMRMVIPFEKAEAFATVTMTVDQSGITKEKAPFILDIDAFRTAKLALDDPKIWSIFEQLRTVKNDVFFKSLTPTALEMFG